MMTLSGDSVTVYRIGEHVDISRGPMVGNTGFLGRRCTIAAVREKSNIRVDSCPVHTYVCTFVILVGPPHRTRLSSPLPLPRCRTAQERLPQPLCFWDLGTAGSNSGNHMLAIFSLKKKTCLQHYPFFTEHNKLKDKWKSYEEQSRKGSIKCKKVTLRYIRIH